MAAISAFASLQSTCFVHSLPSLLSLRTRNLHLQTHVAHYSFFKPLTVKEQTRTRRLRIAMSVEEETQVTDVKERPDEIEEPTSSEQQPVTVPVSPSDTLTMFFQAEGTMNETAIPAVTGALEAIEGVSDLKVKIEEGIASVELKKQTTIQATGVASSLVETIQGSGFKLQTLYLSFDEDEAIAPAYSLDSYA